MGSLSLQAVTKTFGDATVLDSVDLTVRSGEFMVLLGPSGCGKSTLLRIVAGLESPTAGAIHSDGNDITDVSPRDRNLAMVFQSYALYPHLTVAKNIAFPLRTARTSKARTAQVVHEVASTLGLTALLSRRPGQLSGGQRQRVALARAMVRDPDAFLMDEPLSNLDAQLRAVTRTELIELHKRVAKTFLYVTHDQVEAMTMADRIALLNHGRIEQIGTPEQLYDTPKSVFVATFLGAPPMNLLDARVHSLSDALVVDIAGASIPLGINSVDFSDDSRPVKVGIRPERLVINDEGSPAQSGSGRDVAMTATVTLTENLRGDLLVHCDIGRERLCARVPRTARTSELVVGSTIMLTADCADLHLFDPETGRRLRWHAPETPALQPQFTDIGA